MDASVATPTFRIRSIPDLIAIIPRLLTFHPVDSLTLVVVEDGSLVVTARIDLAACTVQCLAERLAPLWRRHPQALFLAVAFCADAAPAWRALDVLAGASPPGLELWRYHADGQRWFDHPGDPGEPYDISCSAVAAQAAYEGMAVSDSRGDLEASVECAVTPKQLTRALRAVGRRRLDHDSLVEEALDLVTRADAASFDLALTDAAILALASHDTAFREAAIWSTSSANASARMGLWGQVVRGTVPSAAGHALVLLGLAAWAAGNGALQVVCIDKARTVASDLEWVTLLEHANTEALPPSQWQAMRAEWFGDRLAG